MADWQGDEESDRKSDGDRIDDREGDEPVAEEQLTLADEHEHLPWLETEEDEEEEGFDTRIVVLALVGLLVVAAIVFGIWKLSGGGTRGDIVADGSTIEAPDEPYRTRPANPGGTEVAGTGDMSYEVGEGQGREGRLVDEAPAPSIDRNQTGARDEAEEEQGAGEAPAVEETQAPIRGVAVQVGAFSTRASADAAWNQFRTRYSALDGANHRIVEGRADSGTIHRLQVIAGDRGSAEALCRSIRSEGGDCQVK